MNIWILNHYASDMYFAEGGRHYYFAKYLKQMGHNPIIFCANSKHNSDGITYFDFKSTWIEKINTETEVPYIFIKVRAYGKNGKDRILNMFDFFHNVIRAGKEYADEKGKPEIIVASSVHPLTMMAGINLAKSFGIKCICEVRDLWPESIVTYLRGFKRNNPIIRLLYLGEKHIYKKADALIFTMEGGYDYIIERGWDKEIPKDKVYHINNGVDLAQFNRNRDVYKISDFDFGKQDSFNVVYAGSIRKVNNLDQLLDIAKLINNRRIKFLIWGDGDELPMLRRRIEEENINNVIFKGKVDKKYVPYITSMADLNIAHNNESPLFRFGISFNKIFDYLAAGKPIICDFYAKYNPVISYGAGVYCRSSEPNEVALQIESFSNMTEEEQNKYASAALKAAQYFDFKNLTTELLRIIEETVKKRA